jgi:hypothetical protein
VTRYTIHREQLPGGWLWQVVDTETGWRSIPAALSACVRLAERLNVGGK